MRSKKERGGEQIKNELRREQILLNSVQITPDRFLYRTNCAAANSLDG